MAVFKKDLLQQTIIFLYTVKLSTTYLLFFFVLGFENATKKQQNYELILYFCFNGNTMVELIFCFRQIIIENLVFDDSKELMILLL